MQREIKKRAGFYGVAAVLLALMLGSIFFGITVIPQIQATVFRAFASTQQIRGYLTTHSGTYAPFLFVGPADSSVNQVRTMMESSQNTYVTAPGLAQESTYTHSTTNIQVSGVDEADIVKTDGEYLCVISGSNVYILKAYPSNESEILSKITFNDTNLVGIFVSKGGNRLAVLGSRYRFPQYYYGYLAGSIIIDVKTFLNVYDISNKSAPSLLTNFTMTGSYFSSRMIGDYVYFVVSQPAYIIYETVIIPKIITSDGIKEISASEVLYSDTSDNYFLYTTVVAMNIATAEEPTHKTIMLGGTSSMYVSLNNIYITFPQPDYTATTIYRIRIDDSTISPEAKGTVSGRELNQFSMDEYNGYFRIATTTATWIDWTRINWNNLFVLDMNLSVVGSLENFTLPNEFMDSARFIGNRCYLSTSVRQWDPFFVIDVSNASKPKILGSLEFPGSTSYLHPYDEDYIVGVGRIGNNVKIRLFDVSNESAPKILTEYTVEGEWSDTPVLTDHKSFLFDKPKDLLAIPLSINIWSAIPLPISNESLPISNSSRYWQLQEWQGLYVFNITLGNGIVLKGNVTQHEDASYNWGYHVNRALYIDNVLYTISETKVQLNNLENLTLIKEITLN